MSLASNRLIAAIFLVVITLPLASNLAGQDGGDAEAENRALAPTATIEWVWTSIASYPDRATAWFDDHFGWRATLVRWYGMSRVFGFGVSPSTTVARGRDDWWFYIDDFGLEDYANTRPLTAFELANWRDAVRRARDWMRSRGGAYVLTVAPDKHVIYPEAFPASVRQVGPVSRTNQLFAAISACGVAVDVRPALREAKSHERVYHMTDTHWNDRGAFAAYREIIAAVRRQNPAVPPAWQRADFDARASDIEALDLASMIGLKRVLREQDLRLVPRRARRAVVVQPRGADPTANEGELITEIPGSSLPRAVIFRDSFASALVPFLSEHFSRAVYLWQNDFVPSAVEREHADVVIQEIVGRHLYSFTPSPELIAE